MKLTVLEIMGDYALVRNVETGLQREVAMALLPDDLQVGDTLLFETFEYVKA